MLFMSAANAQKLLKWRQKMSECNSAHDLTTLKLVGYRKESKARDAYFIFDVDLVTRTMSRGIVPKPTEIRKKERVIFRGMYRWPSGEPTNDTAKRAIEAAQKRRKWAQEDDKKIEKECIDCGRVHSDFGLICMTCVNQILEAEKEAYDKF